MRVLYDISVLGLGHYHSRARTGVFRVVENIAYGLSASNECEFSCCASLPSLLNTNACLDYIRSNSKFQTIPFHHSSFINVFYDKLLELHKLIDIRSSINSSEDKTEYDSLIKEFNNLLTKNIKILEVNQYPIKPNKLTNTDIYHSPFYPLSAQIQQAKNIKKFITIYDLIPIIYPEFFDYKEDHLINNILSSADSNTFFLCISESTKIDLCNYTEIDGSRVFVTPLAANKDVFYMCSDSNKIKSIKSKYGIPDVPYVLSLGTLEPRKNIDTLIKSFAKVVQDQNLKDLYLVLVGTKGWKYEKIFDEISKAGSVKDKIIFTGYVDDKDLAALYSGALVFVYPSFYEGFGLPPLEAMQCGTPVITSNTSSLPEVVGDAGIMLDPKDADGLCQSLLEIYSKSYWREEMSLKSLEQSKRFTWDKCCQKIVDAYKNALED